MTRYNAREIAMQLVFSLSFGNAEAGEVLERDLTAERFQELQEESPLYAEFPDRASEAYIREVVSGVFLHGPELDSYISRYAIGWSFARIPRMAAAILRTVMYEIRYMPDIPNAAAINAAVEIAKKYEDPKTVSFMNGILGSFARAEFPDSPPKPERKSGRRKRAKPQQTGAPSAGTEEAAAPEDGSASVPEAGEERAPGLESAPVAVPVAVPVPAAVPAPAAMPEEKPE